MFLFYFIVPICGETEYLCCNFILSIQASLRALHHSIGDTDGVPMGLHELEDALRDERAKNRELLAERERLEDMLDSKDREIDEVRRLSSLSEQDLRQLRLMSDASECVAALFSLIHCAFCSANNCMDECCRMAL